MKVASLKVIHARNPSFLGTQYTKIKSARKICTRTEKTTKYILYELSYPDDESKILLTDVKVTYINENVENKDRIGNKLLITKKEAKSFKDASSRKQEVIANSKFEDTRKWAGKVNVMTSEEIDKRQASWVRSALLIWAK